MAEKGFLSKKDERWLSKVLDQVVVLNGWPEAIDGTAFSLLISFADNYVVENYVPVEKKNFLTELVQLGREKKTEEIKKLVTEEFAVDNPLIISLGGIALNFVLTAIYEWADNLVLEEEEENA